jgi:hypothetical protein
MTADGDYGEAPPSRRNRLKSVIQNSDGVTTTARGGGGGKQFSTWRQRADAEQGGGARKATRRQQEEVEDKPWEVPRGKHWGVSRHILLVLPAAGCQPSLCLVYMRSMMTGPMMPLSSRPRVRHGAGGIQVL